MTESEQLALTVSKQEAKRLIAKVCTALESFGLPRAVLSEEQLDAMQLDAMKRVVKDVVWDSHGRIEGALRGQYVGTGERP